jgi:hypothetical protein
MFWQHNGSRKTFLRQVTALFLFNYLKQVISCFNLLLNIKVCLAVDEESDYEFDASGFNQHLGEKIDDSYPPQVVEATVPWF